VGAGVSGISNHGTGGVIKIKLNTDESFRRLVTLEGRWTWEVVLLWWRGVGRIFRSNNFRE
jgi:hypothetical protein